MVALSGLTVLSIVIALALVWFIVSREVPGLQALVLSLFALVFVSAICVSTGYFSLRVHINDHFEINLVLLRLLVLPPIIAGLLAGLLSAAMFAVFRRSERA